MLNTFHLRRALAENRDGLIRLAKFLGLEVTRIDPGLLVFSVSLAMVQDLGALPQ